MGMLLRRHYKNVPNVIVEEEKTEVKKAEAEKIEKPIEEEKPKKARKSKDKE